MPSVRRSILVSLAALSAGVASAKAATRPAPDAVHSYMLLDRTGSMQSIWNEALSSVNAYAESFGESEDGDAPLETRVTLAAFDSHDGLQFDVLRKNVPTEKWRNVTSDEASPRGMTPLFDAIGQNIAAAEKDNPEKAVIVIMTDGEENASTEMKKADAKAALDRAEKRGWEVVFLGADFAKFNDADAVGVARAKQMAVSPDKMGETMQLLGKKSRSYGQSSNAKPIEFDEQDRSVADEEKVKQKGKNQ